MTHIVIPRGTHTRADVQAAMYEGFAITQWWPVTTVECQLEHGDLCKAQPFAVENFKRHGLDAKIVHGPAIHVEPCGPVSCVD